MWWKSVAAVAFSRVLKTSDGVAVHVACIQAELNGHCSWATSDTHGDGNSASRNSIDEAVDVCPSVIGGHNSLSGSTGLDGRGSSGCRGGCFRSRTEFIDIETIAATTLLSSVSRARHVATPVSGKDGSIVDGVTAEAFNTVFHTSELVASGLASSCALLNGVGTRSGLTDRESSSSNIISVAALLVPASSECCILTDRGRARRSRTG